MQLIPPSQALRGAPSPIFAADAPAPIERASGDRHVTAERRQGYRIGGVSLLTAYERASELSEMLPIYPLPHSARWFRGLINLHGNLVPVFDLAVMLELPHDPKKHPLLLVLEHGDAAAALVIDGLPVRLRIDPQSHVANPKVPAAIRDFVSGGYLSGNELWLEFEHRRFFESHAELTAA